MCLVGGPSFCLGVTSESYKVSVSTVMNLLDLVFVFLNA